MQFQAHAALGALLAARYRPHWGKLNTLKAGDFRAMARYQDYVSTAGQHLGHSLAGDDRVFREG